MTTEVYKTGAHALAGYIMKQWMRRNWWVMALPPAVCLALAAIVDIKFVLIALIMVFVVLPPIMITVYFYHALAPEARMSILPHRITADDRGLRIIYEPPSDDLPARPDDMIPWSRITKTTVTTTLIAYRLDSGRYTAILLPATAFKSPEHYNAWILNHRP